MKKLLLLLLSFLFCVSTIFSQSYEDWLKKAKEYESQKRWCYALGAYYDAMGTDEAPEIKQEAYEGFETLKDEIISGNPGKGKYNVFTIHDEWKNLLIDAEKYGSSNNMYEISIGELKQGDLEYTTKTATYNAEISYKKGSRYNNTIKIIKDGYKSAYKNDWTDLPEEWPLYSVSSQKNSNYNVNGALVFARDYMSSYQKGIKYLNAFAMLDNDIWSYKTPGLYDYKFNIVDENGKELVKGKRWLLGEKDIISFSGITPDVMELIDSGKAYINPVACYLEYGKFNSDDDKGGRTFIKNFPEIQIPLKGDEFICGVNKYNRIEKNVSLVKICQIPIDMVEIPSIGIEMQTTEVTQELFEAVMNYNPSEHKGKMLPVENFSFFTVMMFCNKLSELRGLTPVYLYNNETDTSKWTKIGNEKGKITQNLKANGYRVALSCEWDTVNTYSETNNYDEIGWFKENSDGTTHPVAQKKSNEFGLFDLYGNVSEWVLENDSEFVIDPYQACYAAVQEGKSYDEPYSEIYSRSTSVSGRRYYLGFRLVKSVYDK